MLDPRKILVVRSGGGIPGLQAHAAMWLSLARRGIVATECCGTSAGAIVSGFDASGIAPEMFAGIVSGLRDRDVRDELLFWRSRYALPFFRLQHFLRHEPIERLLDKYVARDFEAMAKPLRVWATVFNTGRAFEFTAGMGVSARRAILASMSIAGVFPRVPLLGTEFCDGGTCANLPLPDDWQQFDDVWLLIGTNRADGREPDGGISCLLRNVFFMMRDQIEDPVQRCGLRHYDLIKDGYACATAGKTTVRALWPSFRDVGALRFAPGLIERVHETTERLLERAGVN